MSDQDDFDILDNAAKMLQKANLDEARHMCNVQLGILQRQIFDDGKEATLSFMNALTNLRYYRTKYFAMLKQIERGEEDIAE